MMTLVLPEVLSTELDKAANEPLEVAAVLLGRLMLDQNGDYRLLGRQIRWVPAAAYLQQESDALLISSEGYVPALAAAEEAGDVAIWVHTHPGLDGVPKPSKHDHKVDEGIADLFRIRTGQNFYGTLILSPRSQNFTFTGTLQDHDGKITAISRIWCVEERWKLIRSYDEDAPYVSDIFDRNIRAFGPAIQAVLGDLRVGIVGCGGTGSAVGEQLVRLGVRNLLLIDPDVLSESNVTRVYGSYPMDVGRSKVDVLGEHLTRIAPDLTCKRIIGMVTMEAVARETTTCDILFGCTDDNAGRMVLSRLSSFFLLPVIDVGVLLSSTRSGQLSGIDGRVTTLSPGTACLICRERIDLGRAASELLTPEERKKLVEEGYAPALGRTEPAVVAFTTGVAAAAINEFLERLIGYGPEPRPTEVLIRWHDRELSTNLCLPRDKHYCHPNSGKLGIGETKPFLEQVWAG